MPGYFAEIPANPAKLRTKTAATEAAGATAAPGASAMPVNGAVLIFTSTNGHAQSQNGHGNHSLIPPFTHSLIGGGTDLLVQRFDELREQPARLIFDQRGRRGIRQKSAGRVMLSVAITTSHLLESDLLRGLLPHLPQYLKLVSSTNSQTPKEIAIRIAAELNSGTARGVGRCMYRGLCGSVRGKVHFSAPHADSQSPRHPACYTSTLGPAGFGAGQGAIGKLFGEHAIAVENGAHGAAEHHFAHGPFGHSYARSVAVPHGAIGFYIDEG